MTVYDLIKVYEGPMNVLNDARVNISNVRYIDLYKEYLRLSNEGHKQIYIVDYLMERFSVGQATVYRVIRKFSERVDVV